MFEKGHRPLKSRIVALAPGNRRPVLAPPLQGQFEIRILIQSSTSLLIESGGAGQSQIQTCGLLLLFDPGLGPFPETNQRLVGDIDHRITLQFDIGRRRQKPASGPSEMIDDIAGLFPLHPRHGGDLTQRGRLAPSL